MLTSASHSPSRIPMIREKDILVLRDILEGKLAGRRPRSCVDGQTITARFIWSPHNLLWASRAAGDPDPDLLDSVRPGKRRQGPTVARVPAPPHKVVVADVVEQVPQRPPAILLRILDLPAQLTRRPPGKHHLNFQRRQRPSRTARRQVRPGKIRGLMACIAAHCGYFVSIGAELHVLQVHVAVISLQRSIARRMAVLASRRSQYAIKLQKRCA